MSFVALPDQEALRLAWPTRRRDLFEDPASYIARTPANPDYGKPGWTRDAGRRFHGGVDIAPLRTELAGHVVRLVFTDLATGTEYEAGVPACRPDDEAFAVYGGVVEEAVEREEASDFGLHVVLRHRWPCSGGTFFTLYGHLASVAVRAGQPVAAGALLGHMGATSRIADARDWMAAFPHLHVEVWNEERQRCDPLAFLTRWLKPR